MRFRRRKDKEERNANALVKKLAAATFFRSMLLIFAKYYPIIPLVFLSSVFFNVSTKAAIEGSLVAMAIYIWATERIKREEQESLHSAHSRFCSKCGSELAE